MSTAYYKKAVSIKVHSVRRHIQVPLFSVALMVFGALVIGSVAGPIAGYFLFVAPKLQGNVALVSPLPSFASFIFTQVAAAPIVYNELEYYRKPENWFPSADFSTQEYSKITHYNLSIPTLNINGATVEISGKDLTKELIQYPGTANPGELGSVVVFGHSILRQFYNPQNYVSIFSKIMTLKNGEPIEISYGGVRYVYKVIDKVEVKPEDVQILQQQYNGRYLKLVTCVPEGTFLRRGIVIAELDKT